MSGLLGRLDRRWMAPGSSHVLASVRIAAASALGLRLALRDWAKLSSDLFRPKGFVSWIPAMPSPTVISLLQIIGVSAAALTIAAAVTPRLSRFGRPALLVAWASLLVLAGLRDATHVKVLHNDVLMLLAFLPLAVGAADVRLGDRSESVRWGWPRRLAVAVVGLAYFFTAYQKLRITGLDWVTSDNLRWVMVEGLVSDRAPTRVVASWLVDRPLVCHGLAAITILTELSAPVVLATRRTRPWFFLVAVALHGGIWLTLGLDYWGWILTVGALVLPWHRVRSVSVLAV